MKNLPYVTLVTLLITQSAMGMVDECIENAVKTYCAEFTQTFDSPDYNLRVNTGQIPPLFEELDDLAIQAESPTPQTYENPRFFIRPLANDSYLYIEVSGKNYHNSENPLKPFIHYSLMYQPADYSQAPRQVAHEARPTGIEHIMNPEQRRETIFRDANSLQNRTMRTASRITQQQIHFHLK